ncbi:MAG: hypothetical protein KME11_09220 [Timaviella obliquedivisa GSE-PSE-MK23-08B]|jgi:hypothetical protein|nr:hypothetical protein [Timaviella obliquedivisa GSE-PSE-MK23-08B]
MSEYGGFIWVVDESNRASLLKGCIKYDKTFTDTMSASDWQTKYAEIFLISFDTHNIHYAAIARRSKKVVTDKYIIRLSNFVQFTPCIPFGEIETLLSSSVKRYFNKSSTGTGQRVPPKTWNEVTSAIKRLRPEASEDFDRLYSLRQITRSLLDRSGAEILLQERDAVNLSLRIADFDPIELTDWTPPEEKLAPFLKGLRSAVLIEDQMIAHDAEIFGDWKRIQRYLVGTAIFEKGNEQLTIMNVNRHVVEQTAGVDLIYYFHKFKSYILIQYKRMMRESDGLMYRLNDESYKKELSRMEKLDQILNDNLQLSLPLDNQLVDYRLNQGNLYFKLCPAEIIDITSTDMIQGMYIPLDYWKLLICSDQTLGPKGGRRMTFNNVGRYFNNTLFIGLVQDGWVGSQVKNEDIITEFIKQAMETNRSVILSSLKPIVPQQKQPKAS